MGDEFVMLPVPVSRVQEVYAVLARSPGSGSPTASSSDTREKEKDWTAELVRRMFNESADAMQQMLRLLADADGSEVSTNEIASRLRLPKGAMSVGGMAGALGRRVSSRYGMPGLPWTTKWRFIDPADETRGTETLIAMLPWVCKVIREI